MSHLVRHLPVSKTCSKRLPSSRRQHTGGGRQQQTKRLRRRHRRRRWCRRRRQVRRKLRRGSPGLGPRNRAGRCASFECPCACPRVHLHNGPSNVVAGRKGQHSETSRLLDALVRIATASLRPPTTREPPHATQTCQVGATGWQLQPTRLVGPKPTPPPVPCPPALPWLGLTVWEQGREPCVLCSVRQQRKWRQRLPGSVARPALNCPAAPTDLPRRLRLYRHWLRRCWRQEPHPRHC